MSNTQVPDRRVLWMPLDVAWRAPSPDAQFCCRAMSSALDFGCDQHADPFDCGDALVVYNEVFDEYGLIIHDGGASYVLIAIAHGAAANSRKASATVGSTRQMQLSNVARRYPDTGPRSKIAHVFCYSQSRLTESPLC